MAQRSVYRLKGDGDQTLLLDTSTLTAALRSRTGTVHVGSSVKELVFFAVKILSDEYIRIVMESHALLFVRISSHHESLLAKNNFRQEASRFGGDVYSSKLAQGGKLEEGTWKLSCKGDMVQLTIDPTFEIEPFIRLLRRFLSETVLDQYPTRYYRVPLCHAAEAPVPAIETSPSQPASSTVSQETNAITPDEIAAEWKKAVEATRAVIDILHAISRRERHGELGHLLRTIEKKLQGKLSPKKVRELRNLALKWGKRDIPQG